MELRAALPSQSSLQIPRLHADTVAARPTESTIGGAVEHLLVLTETGGSLACAPPTPPITDASSPPTPTLPSSIDASSPVSSASSASSPASSASAPTSTLSSEATTGRSHRPFSCLCVCFDRKILSDDERFHNILFLCDELQDEFVKRVKFGLVQYLLCHKKNRGEIPDTVIELLKNRMKT